jgi:hypothetical protein
MSTKSNFGWMVLKARGLGRLAARWSLMLIIVVIGQGCAGTDPQVVQYLPYQERAQTEVEDYLQVRAAVLTVEEATATYGVDLAEKLIQPVWIEVRNDTAVPYWFLTSGLDPNYFASPEAAYAFHSTSDDANHSIDERFDSLQFRNPIMPGTTVSGFLLTNLDEGVKAVDVDLVTRGDAKSFTFVTLDPTFKRASTHGGLDGLYKSDELIHAGDEDELRTLLEQLPCCTRNKDGTEEGDPLNLVLIGARSDLIAALVRRQWHPTEIIHAESLWRTIKSFFQGSRYRYSPISPLYVYGRPQDGATQKARATIHERNHARFWLSPIRFHGKEVWVGQISRDIGVKYTLKSPTISTHVIDPDVDEARRYLLEDLVFSQALNRIGYVKGVGAISRDAPRFNLVGDPYYTDGLRAVMFFEPRPFTLSDLDILDWERLPSLRRGSEHGPVGE